MQIIKRLLLGIPTILVISSVVFFLSKLMPGTSGAYLLEDNLLMGSQVQLDVREKIYKEYLQKTGQDKPLFYFRFAALAEPDTLYKISPESHQGFVKKLCFTYGDWDFVRKYYLALLNHQKTIEKPALAGAEENYRHQIAITPYFDAFTANDIQSRLNDTEEYITKTNNEDLKNSFIRLKSSFEQMNLGSNLLRKFVPAIYWYGTANQYHHWLSNLIKGDMGNSLRNQRPVHLLIKEALGITLLMTVLSTLAGWLISVVLALGINLSQGKKMQKPLLSFLYVLDTLPLFLISFLVLILFSGDSFSGLLPSFGLGNYQMIDNYFLRLSTLLQHLLLPVFCMTLVLLPYLVGQIDRAIKDVSELEYIKTARAKGLSERVVLVKHIFRNTSSTLITLLTENLPALLGGALVVEVIFAVPGMGRLLVGAVNARDYPIVLGIVILVAIVKILSNILADVLYKLSDPRIKLSE